MDQSTTALSMNSLTDLMSSVEILDPSERIKRFGLECRGPSGDGITFKACMIYMCSCIYMYRCSYIWIVYTHTCLSVFICMYI
jgi:hypothetical protein